MNLEEALGAFPLIPFKLVHNGVSAYGGLVRLTTDGFTFWDGSRTYEIDESYTPSVTGDAVKFQASDASSTFTFSPLTVKSAKQFPELAEAKTDEELLTLADQILKDSAGVTS